MDPRVVRTLHAVRVATLVVLGRVGYAAFTVEAVAAEAGVSKSTIYRHWPTKLALITDALEALNEQPRPAPEAPSARAEIERLIEHLADVFAGSVLSDCIPALIGAAEHHPEIATFLHGYSDRRRRRLEEAIRRGVEGGELPAHVDARLAALALSGAIIYRRTMTARPLSRRDAARLVEVVLGPHPR
jgi:AcrR family transcriptional regulator